MIIRIRLIGLVVAAVAVSACGSDAGISKSEADQLQEQPTERQQRAQTTAADVKAGKVDAERRRGATRQRPLRSPRSASSGRDRTSSSASVL